MFKKQKNELILEKNITVLDQHLHIVSYSIPFPPDYGGVIDVYYRIKSLHQLGVKIHLHCYEYRGSRNKELESLCDSVNYYPRKLGWRFQFSMKPYIISSRCNKELLGNLLKFDAPILFDGLHSTYGLDSAGLKNRKKIVRAHNIEHEYYFNLGLLEKNFLKKLYFFIESFKLWKYERILHKADAIAAISLTDNIYFKANYRKSFFLPAFHHFTKVESKPGIGGYILFHGNLMISENVQIAEWIIRNIADKINYPVYIAGKNPMKRLSDLCKRYSNVTLVSNPDEVTMQHLISEAHINLLPLFKSYGLKLKLLYALYSGRHCLVNETMVEGTMLDNLCFIADSADKMVSEINRLFEIPFTTEHIEKRNQLLALNYDNIQNAQKIIRIINNSPDDL